MKGKPTETRDSVNSEPWIDGEVDQSWRSVLRSYLTNALSQVATAGALIAIFVFLSIASPEFLTPGNLFNVGTQIAVTAILAIGMTVVIITAGIDLSVGSIAALAGVIGAVMVANLGLPFGVAIVGGVAIGAAAGLCNGLLVAYTGLAPFIATIGMLSVARGLTYLSTDAQPVILPISTQWLGVGSVVAGIPVPVVFLAVLVLAGHFLLTRTTPGRYFYAIGSNEQAARLSGVPVRGYLTLVYVLSGALAGLGGMIAASRAVSGQPNFGIGLELDVIAAVVIGGASLFGGRGTIGGALLGAFLIALIRNGSVLLDINTYWQSVILGVLIWAGVLFDQFRRKRLASAT